MPEVIATDDLVGCYDELSDVDTDVVTRVVDMLESAGVKLAHPYSSAINGSKYALREPRVHSSGAQIRVFYAFDPKRQAVLLIGGHKTDGRFYDEYVPRAEHIWKDYLDGK